MRHQNQDSRQFKFMCQNTEAGQRSGQCQKRTNETARGEGLPTFLDVSCVILGFKQRAGLWTDSWLGREYIRLDNQSKIYNIY